MSSEIEGCPGRAVRNGDQGSGGASKDSFLVSYTQVMKIGSYAANPLRVRSSSLAS
jgi:hypothetical protein